MLKGDLSLISLASIVQLCCQEKKTGCLSLYIDSEKIGDIFFHKGEIVSAQMGDLKGETAFYKLFDIEKAEFAFQNEVSLPPREISLSCEHLLLEAARHQDEAKSRLQNTIKKFNKIKPIIDIAPPSLFHKEIYQLFSRISRLLEAGVVECFWYRQNNQLFLILKLEEEILKLTLPPEAIPEEIILQIKKVLAEEE
ncbi:MAG: DUF4388 domain-containing protein [Candidatus Desulfofervidaceae bacterium]|nr:DUF4388 domain-containing protein [Candidatus Desulfofervidaceae bacterium]